MHTKATQAISDAVYRRGGKCFFVGGCVRDTIMSITPKDRDLLVTGLTVEQLMEILPGRIDEVGKSFGILKVTLEGETVDVALPRTERSMGSGHRDFLVVSDPNLTVEDDLARRDFTMNAIAIEAIDGGQSIDPFSGIRDIKDSEIKCVGDPNARFSEDPLRMLRAIRFSTRFSMAIGFEMDEALVNNAHLIKTVSSERIFDEMNKILMCEDGEEVTKSLEYMVSVGMIGQIIPELMASVKFEQQNHHHDLTVDQHVLKALEYAIDKGASLRARWAVFLHDVAKPRCFELDAEGNGHFYGHEKEGEEVAAAILARLRAPTDLIQGVSKIIGNHLRPPPRASDKTLRKFIADMGDLTEDALMCRESDSFAHIDGESRAAEIASYREQIKTFSEVKGFSEAKLALRGDEIAQIFGVKGKDIGMLKKLAAEAVIDGRVPNEREALIEMLKEDAPYTNPGMGQIIWAKE